jgi:hypothetical protein
MLSEQRYVDRDAEGKAQYNLVAVARPATEDEPSS